MCLLVGGVYLFTKIRTNWTSRESAKPVPFRVVQGLTLLNAERVLDKPSGFWAEYKTPLGLTASPIAVLTLVKITNLTEKPEFIRNYTVSLRSDRCRSMDLYPIPSKEISVLYLVDGFKQASFLDFSGNALDSELEAPVLPGKTVAGFLFFDAPIACRVQPGEEVQYRFVFKTDEGEIFGFTSETSDSALSSEASAIASQLDIRNTSVDLSSSVKAIRFWSDPLPSVPRQQ